MKNTSPLHGQSFDERVQAINAMCGALQSITSNGLYRHDFRYIKKAAKRLTKKIVRAFDGIDASA